MGGARIVIAISLVSLGLRAGAVVARRSHSCWRVFVVMEYSDIDLQRMSLGALIIAWASWSTTR